MPTASKLIGAVSFLLVAFFGAEVMKPYFPEGYSPGSYSIFVALIGLIVGWRTMGPNAGRGMVKAFGTGIRTSITIVFWGLLLFAIVEMLKRSTDRRYDGVTEALLGTFDIMIEYGKIVISAPPTLGVLVIGGLFSAWLTELAARRWS